MRDIQNKLRQAHERMEAGLQFFWRAVRAGDGSVAAHWLNEYHREWDYLESLGVSMRVPLPEFCTLVEKKNSFPRMRFINWDLHHGNEGESFSQFDATYEAYLRRVPAKQRYEQPWDGSKSA